ncbi:MAG TPA: hypothetical protein VNN25_08435 [Thermoanaerobaculia bacterium]|nr:hypothetical protein [Thermoanaerobaculia bacterium]
MRRQPPIWHFAAVYETRLVLNERLVIAVPPVKVEVITGPAYMFRLSNDRAVVPLMGKVGEEVEIPSPPAIDLEAGKRYIIVSTRTNENPAVVEEECRRVVDRMIGIIGLLSSPTLFALPIYVGWVSATPSTPLNTKAMFSKPEQLNRAALEKGVSIARRVLARDPAMRDRFDLVARLFSRTMGSPPTDEAFLWAWTCLEVFPMMGTQKHRHIAPYLAKLTGDDEAALAARLDIRGLYILRSKLVHSGHLGLGDTELYRSLTILRGIVCTVMRGMCGLPYDGELERVVQLREQPTVIPV